MVKLFLVKSDGAVDILRCDDAFIAVDLCNNQPLYSYRYAFIYDQRNRRLIYVVEVVGQNFVNTFFLESMHRVNRGDTIQYFDTTTGKRSIQCPAIQFQLSGYEIVRFCIHDENWIDMSYLLPDNQLVL